MNNDSGNQLDLIAQKLKPIPLPPLPANPLVSVLTANYNYSQYIGEAIESVQKQTYTNWEMIICDDGSTDNSCQVVERYMRRDPRINLIRKENGGTASALNAAYATSSGEVICLLDADDTFRPTKLEKIVDAFARSPHAGMVVHRVLRVTAKGKPRGVMPLTVHVPSGWLARDAYRAAGIVPDLPPCSGLSLRSGIASRVFPLSNDFVRGADGVIQRLCLLISPVMGLGDSLATYRFHSSNLTNTGTITPAYLQRELGIWRRLWDVQKKYLETVDPVLGDHFPTLDGSLAFLIAEYARARLEREDTSASRRYDSMVGHPSFRQQSAVRRWFWKASILLPCRLFRPALDLMSCQGVTKQLISRLAGVAR